MSARLYSPEQEQQIVELRQAGTTLSALCQQFGGSLPTMRKCLERNGVGPLPTGRPTWRVITPEQVAEMAELWYGGLSQREVGEKYGVDQATMSALLRAHSGRRPARKANVASGPEHGSWKGGRIDQTGYVAVLVPRDSPYRCMAFSSSGYVLEHRLVMAQSLGRPLTSNETVHHINGDKTDNRIENLQLWQGRHGKGVVMRCADCGSYNLEHVEIASG